MSNSIEMRADETKLRRQLRATMLRRRLFAQSLAATALPLFRFTRRTARKQEAWVCATPGCGAELQRGRAGRRCRACREAA